MPPDEVRKLSNKLDQVLYILNNDEDTGSEGLVAKLRNLEKGFNAFVKQYEIDQAVKRGKNAVWTMIFSAIGTAFVFLIKFIFVK